MRSKRPRCKNVEILLLFGLAFAVIYPVYNTVSHRKPDHHSFYRDGYMREEVEALDINKPQS